MAHYYLNDKKIDALDTALYYVPKKVDLSMPYTMTYNGLDYRYTQAVPERQFKPGDVVQVSYGQRWYTYVRNSDGWLTGHGVVDDTWMRSKFDNGQARVCEVVPVD